MQDKEVVYLTRDCYALMVPSGARIMLHKDSEVIITQSLGQSYTVNIYGNLARIEGHDADALGKENTTVLPDLPVDATIDDYIWAELRTVYDPEIPVNVVELGLIYDCKVETDENNQYLVKIVMTLTAPGCGMGPVIADEVKHRVMGLPNVINTEVEIVFDPPWSQEKMSDAAKLELGMF
jgi:probable FeS assembly SUF system protein SufT